MIKDLKELKSLLLLCRKQGVDEITLGDCHIKFGSVLNSHVPTPEEQVPLIDELTEEQLMYYSVEGVSQ